MNNFTGREGKQNNAALQFAKDAGRKFFRKQLSLQVCNNNEI